MVMVVVWCGGSVREGGKEVRRIGREGEREVTKTDREEGIKESEVIVKKVYI